MGMFATSVYSEGTWGDSAGGDVWLRVDIYDSDIATIDYAPVEAPRGRFFLGYEPRDYFDDPVEGEPVDREAEAETFTRWAGAHLDQAIAPASVAALMADPARDEAVDVFVEETVVRLLHLLDLPVPAFLAGVEPPA